MIVNNNWCHAADVYRVLLYSVSAPLVSYDGFIYSILPGLQLFDLTFENND